MITCVGRLFQRLMTLTVKLYWHKSDLRQYMHNFSGFASPVITFFHYIVTFCLQWKFTCVCLFSEFVEDIAVNVAGWNVWDGLKRYRGCAVIGMSYWFGDETTQSCNHGSTNHVSCCWLFLSTSVSVRDVTEPAKICIHLERLKDGNIHMCFSSRSGYRPFITPPPALGN